MPEIIKVIEAATQKFGEVIGIQQTQVQGRKDHTYKVTIIRTSPPLPEAPCMTITAYMTLGEVAFIWGHYDLTLEQVA